MKIFLDANIFVAACGNEKGGSSYLFEVAKHDATWHLLTSPLAIQEANKNVQTKLPKKMPALTSFILHPSLTIANSPSHVLVERLRGVITEKDVPILAAAIMVQADYLCTLDKKDFHNTKVKTWSERHGLNIVTPHDVLNLWRKSKL